MANKEKVSQKVQEAIFAQLLTNPINNECADCHTSSPNWVSLDFGVFICMRCSGVHRQLGPHISRVRSLKLDGWTKDNIEIMATVGNKIANDYYEHKMPTGYRRPGANSSADECRRFIDDKYINKRFIPPGFPEPVKDFVACREKGTKPDFSYSQQKQNKPQQQAPQPVTEPKKQPQPAFGFIRKKSTSLDPVEHHHHDKKTNHQAHHHPDLLSADVDLLGNYSESNDSNSQGIHSASPPAKKINFANFKKAQSQPATVPLHHHQSQPDLTTTFPWGQEAQQTANNNNNNAQPQPQENKVDLMKLYTQPQGHQNHFMQGMNPGWQQYGQWNGGMNQGYNNGYMGHQNNFQAGYQQQQNFGAQQGFQGGQNMGYNPYVNHGNQQGHAQNQFGNNGFVQAQGQNNYF